MYLYTEVKVNKFQLSLYKQKVLDNVAIFVSALQQLDLCSNASHIMFSRDTKITSTNSNSRVVQQNKELGIEQWYWYYLANPGL